VLLAFKEIELDADRTWVKDIIQPQWLNKLFYKLLGLAEDYEENPPEAKLTYEFQDITFETNLDKVNASLLLYDRQLISGEKVLRVAGYEDEIEEYKLRKEEIEEAEQQKMRADLLLKKQNQNEMGNEENENDGKESDYSTTRVNEQVSTTYRKRQASLYKKFEETLDAIKDG
jgi:hypothetical protein